MIGRASIIEADPGKIDAGITFVRDRVQPAIEAMPGSRGLGLWVNRETGASLVVTSWEDRAALEASESQAAGLRTQAAELLGATSVQVQVAEPAVIWQARADQPGYWARFAQMDMPPERLDEAVTSFRDENLPEIQQIPGVNTIVLLVNRETGSGVLNITFTNKPDFDATREMGKTKRAEFASQWGATETMLLEFEVVLAGIRGPDIIGQSSPSADRPTTTQD
jgi:hypothetical protein